MTMIPVDIVQGKVSEEIKLDEIIHRWHLPGRIKHARSKLDESVVVAALDTFKFLKHKPVNQSFTGFYF
jgi:hypothetical protein